MRSAPVAAAVAASFIVALGVAIPSSAQADILVTVTVSKADQRVSVDVDGTERYRWPVSTGRSGYSTPSGSFRPIRLEKSWYSRKYDWAPMPHSIFFYKGYAMHGTVEERRLGRAASHGCVRLSRANASTLFALLRERGKSSTRIEVIDGRLPAPLADPKLNIAEVKSSLRGESRDVAKAEKVEAKVEAKVETKTETKTKTKTAAKAEPAPVIIKAAVKPDADIPLPRAATRLAKADVAALPPKARIIAATPTAEKAHIEIVRGGPFTSVGDEAAVMRGREAWLRSLDRKYGIVR